MTVKKQLEQELTVLIGCGWPQKVIRLKKTHNGMKKKFFRIEKSEVLLNVTDTL